MADRGATAAALAEMAKASNQPVHLLQVALDAPTGTIYATDAYKDIEWGGNIYTALGHLLSFSDIEETAELQVASLTVTLSGVDQAYISLFLSEHYIDRALRIYTGFLDSSDTLIADPVLIFDGRMDQPVIQEDPDAGTSVVAVRATNAWVDFERRPGRHTNHQEQQIWFPGDRGFEFASEIVKDIVWGRPA